MRKTESIKEFSCDQHECSKARHLPVYLPVYEKQRQMPILAV